MVEDPDAIREAIDETRADLAETIDALGQKADVKSRAADTFDNTKEQVRAKASALGRRADEAVPDQARPVVDQAKSGTSKAAVATQRRPGVVAAVAGVVLFALIVRRRRRRKDR
jgi:ElaB/YqjD/DUF883 family membrane-anchored ribosome-binding protein